MRHERAFAAGLHCVADAAVLSYPVAENSTCFSLHSIWYTPICGEELVVIVEALWNEEEFIVFVASGTTRMSWVFSMGFTSFFH